MDEGFSQEPPHLECAALRVPAKPPRRKPPPPMNEGITDDDVPF